MYFHLTNTQVIIVSFALVLIIIFALAAFLDKRRRATATRRDFATDDTPDILRQSPVATTKSISFQICSSSFFWCEACALKLTWRARTV